MMQSKIVKRSIVVDHHKTSVSLEEEFWTGMREIARTQRQTITGLVSAIKKDHEGNLSSAIRRFVLAYYRAAPAVSAHNLSI